MANVIQQSLQNILGNVNGNSATVSDQLQMENLRNNFQANTQGLSARELQQITQEAENLKKALSSASLPDSLKNQMQALADEFRDLANNGIQGFEKTAKAILEQVSALGDYKQRIQEIRSEINQMPNNIPGADSLKELQRELVELRKLSNVEIRVDFQKANNGGVVQKSAEKILEEYGYLTPTQIDQVIAEFNRRGPAMEEATKNLFDKVRQALATMGPDAISNIKSTVNDLYETLSKFGNNLNVNVAPLQQVVDVLNVLKNASDSDATRIFRLLNVELDKLQDTLSRGISSDLDNLLKPLILSGNYDSGMKQQFSEVENLVKSLENAQRAMAESAKGMYTDSGFKQFFDDLNKTAGEFSKTIEEIKTKMNTFPQGSGMHNVFNNLLTQTQQDYVNTMQNSLNNSHLVNSANPNANANVDEIRKHLLDAYRSQMDQIYANNSNYDPHMQHMTHLMNNGYRNVDASANRTFDAFNNVNFNYDQIYNAQQRNAVTRTLGGDVNLLNLLGFRQESGVEDFTNEAQKQYKQVHNAYSNFLDSHNKYGTMQGDEKAKEEFFQTDVIESQRKFLEAVQSFSKLGDKLNLDKLQDAPAEMQKAVNGIMQLVQQMSKLADISNDILKNEALGNADAQQQVDDLNSIKNDIHNNTGNLSNGILGSQMGGGRNKSLLNILGGIRSGIFNPMMRTGQQFGNLFGFGSMLSPMSMLQGTLNAYMQDEDLREQVARTNMAMMGSAGWAGDQRYLYEGVNEQSMNLANLTHGVLKPLDMTQNYLDLSKNLVGGYGENKLAASADMSRFSETNTLFGTAYGVSNSQMMQTEGELYKDLRMNASDTISMLYQFTQVAKDTNIPVGELMSSVTGLAKSYKALGLNAKDAMGAVINGVVDHNMSLDDATAYAGAMAQGENRFAMNPGMMAYTGIATGQFQDPFSAISAGIKMYNPDTGQATGLKNILPQMEYWFNNIKDMSGGNNDEALYLLQSQAKSQLGLNDQWASVFAQRAMRDGMGSALDIFDSNTALGQKYQAQSDPQAQQDQLINQISNASKYLSGLTATMNDVKNAQFDLAEKNKNLLDDFTWRIDGVMNGFSNKILGLPWGSIDKGLTGIIDSNASLIEKIAEMTIIMGAIGSGLSMLSGVFGFLSKGGGLLADLLGFGKSGKGSKGGKGGGKVLGTIGAVGAGIAIFDGLKTLLGGSGNSSSSGSDSSNPMSYVNGLFGNAGAGSGPLNLQGFLPNTTNSPYGPFMQGGNLFPNGNPGVPFSGLYPGYLTGPAPGDLSTTINAFSNAPGVLSAAQQQAYADAGYYNYGGTGGGYNWGQPGSGMYGYGGGDTSNQYNADVHSNTTMGDAGFEVGGGVARLLGFRYGQNVPMFSQAPRQIAGFLNGKLKFNPRTAITLGRNMTKLGRGSIVTDLIGAGLTAGQDIYDDVNNPALQQYGVQDTIGDVASAAGFTGLGAGVGALFGGVGAPVGALIGGAADLVDMGYHGIFGGRRWSDQAGDAISGVSSDDVQRFKDTGLDDNWAKAAAHVYENNKGYMDNFFKGDTGQTLVNDENNWVKEYLDNQNKNASASNDYLRQLTDMTTGNNNIQQKIQQANDQQLQKLIEQGGILDSTGKLTGQFHSDMNAWYKQYGKDTKTNQSYLDSVQQSIGTDAYKQLTDLASQSGINVQNTGEMAAFFKVLAQRGGFSDQVESITKGVSGLLGVSQKDLSNASSGALKYGDDMSAAGFSAADKNVWAAAYGHALSSGKNEQDAVKAANQAYNYKHSSSVPDMIDNMVVLGATTKGVTGTNYNSMFKSLFSSQYAGHQDQWDPTYGYQTEDANKEDTQTTNDIANSIMDSFSKKMGISRSALNTEVNKNGFLNNTQFAYFLASRYGMGPNNSGGTLDPYLDPALNSGMSTDGINYKTDAQAGQEQVLKMLGGDPNAAGDGSNTGGPNDPVQVAKRAQDQQTARQKQIDQQQSNNDMFQTSNNQDSDFYKFAADAYTKMVAFLGKITDFTETLTKEELDTQKILVSGFKDMRAGITDMVTEENNIATMLSGLSNQLLQMGSLGGGGFTGTNDLGNLANYKSTNNSGVTAATINSQLQGTSMAGMGQTFIDAGKKYGIDPALLVAIANAEQGFNDPGNHNLFGLTEGVGYGNGHKTGGFADFNSIKDGIYAAANNLFDYKQQGITSLADIQKNWAPYNAKNDPNGLNNNWLHNVADELHRLGIDGGNAAGIDPNSNVGLSSLFTATDGLIGQGKMKYQYGAQATSWDDMIQQNIADCSEYVQQAYKKFLNISLPRTSEAMYNDTQGQSIDKSNQSALKPGDLVFFHSDGGKTASHVGIYAGNNKFYDEQDNGLKLDMMNPGTYWGDMFDGAKRFPGANATSLGPLQALTVGLGNMNGTYTTSDIQGLLNQNEQNAALTGYISTATGNNNSSSSNNSNNNNSNNNSNNPSGSPSSDNNNNNSNSGNGLNANAGKAAGLNNSALIANQAPLNMDISAISPFANYSIKNAGAVIDMYHHSDGSLISPSIAFNDAGKNMQSLDKQSANGNQHIQVNVNAQGLSINTEFYQNLANEVKVAAQTTVENYMKKMGGVVTAANQSALNAALYGNNY